MVALAIGLDGIVADAALVHGVDMALFVGRRNPDADPDGLHAREVGMEIERGHVVVQVVPVHHPAGDQQALYPEQHLLVGGHALLDTADRFAQRKVELSLHLFLGCLPFMLPEHPRNTQRTRQDEQGQQKEA